MSETIDNFFWRLDCIEKELEKISHRLRVAFNIRFDEAEELSPNQHLEFPFGQLICHDKNVLRVRGNFFYHDGNACLFRFWELCDLGESHCWPCSSSSQSSEESGLPEPITGTLGVWYYSPNAECGQTGDVSDSMERTFAVFESIFDTLAIAPETVRQTLKHCYEMNEWAVVLLYLTLVRAHPTLKLLGASLPRHAENDLVLRFSPERDVVTLTLYVLEVLRQIAKGGWCDIASDQHADVPLADVVLTDAHGESEAKLTTGDEATPEVPSSESLAYLEALTDDTEPTLPESEEALAKITEGPQPEVKDETTEGEKQDQANVAINNLVNDISKTACDLTKQRIAEMIMESKEFRPDDDPNYEAPGSRNRDCFWWHLRKAGCKTQAPIRDVWNGLTVMARESLGDGDEIGPSHMKSNKINTGIRSHNRRLPEAKRLQKAS